VPDHEPVLTDMPRYVEYTDQGIDSSGRQMLFAVALHFNEGVLVIEVDPDDDTVSMRLSPVVDLVHWPHAVATDRSVERSWPLRLGANCRWRWLLMNQQGYQDGA
jgi:hypothetical protein